MKSSINIPEYKVSQFNKLFKEIIEINFSYIRIKGEISEIKMATRGQIYLTLKDGSSILSGVIWETKKKFLEFMPEEGMEVVVTGKITTWSKFKTTYQIDIDKLEVAGEGALLKLIEDRKKKLKERGFFEQKFKKRIPYMPSKIGVITSPTGSVIHDIINRIKERFPIKIDIWPVAVQGTNSVINIIDAIKGFNSKDYDSKPDVIIIARGGGSTEDLMSFNDENLAIEVFNSNIPIISAIGHETDTSIVDLVSDLRVSTPTAAAEKSVPVLLELIQVIKNLKKRLNFFVENKSNDSNSKLKNLSRYIKAPKIIIESHKNKFNLIYHNFIKELLNLKKSKQDKLNQVSQLIKSPSYQYKSKINDFNNIIKIFDINIQNNIINKTKDFEKFNRLLNSNSLNSNLKKGYSIIKKSNKIIRNSNLLNNDDIIKIQFSDKNVSFKIKEI